MFEEDEGLEINCTLCDYVLRTNVLNEHFQYVIVLVQYSESGETSYVTLTLSRVKARD